MPPPDKTQKARARLARRRASSVVNLSVVASPTLMLVPAAGLPLSIAAAVIGGLYNQRADRQGEIAADPPRDDFLTPTTVEESRLHRDVLRDSERFERSALELATAVEEGGRTLAALVTAIERTLGAELAQRPDIASERTAEAYNFAATAARTFYAAAEAVGPYADALAAYENLPVPRPTLFRALALVAPATVTKRFLPPEALVTLREISARPEALRSPRLIPDQPVAAWIAALRDQAIEDADYGAFLQEAVASGSLLASSSELLDADA